MFIYRQGRIAFPGLGLDLSAAELDAIRIESRPKSGQLRHLRPIVEILQSHRRIGPCRHRSWAPMRPEWLGAGRQTVAAE